MASSQLDELDRLDSKTTGLLSKKKYFEELEKMPISRTYNRMTFFLRSRKMESIRKQLVLAKYDTSKLYHSPYNTIMRYVFWTGTLAIMNCRVFGAFSKYSVGAFANSRWSSLFSTSTSFFPTKLFWSKSCFGTG